jgi:ketosteroid isomerase-like protein
MPLSNEEIIKKYFDAYSKHDLNAIKEVMDENVTWYFLGNHPLAGIKKGINEVVAFFDTMGEIMKNSNPTMDKLITASNDKYFIECQHHKTNRLDGNNIDHHSCVLWTIERGKIVEGRHFFADGPAADKYFMAVAPKK